MVKGILGIQIFGMFFSCIMIYLTFLHYKRKEFSVEIFFFWLTLWLGFIFMVVYPTSLDFLIRGILKFGRRLDFFIVLGFIFLIALMYYNYIVVRYTKKRVERIIREVALEKVKDCRDKKDNKKP
ncbi:DUF2304 domain-containing protein [Candidatus Woesearchaeota archaeon]|nr:DUF2304 domain-containing protein [Candidatus Woesearchaeota archaeon]